MWEMRAAPMSLVRLPRNPRARAAYAELRKMGYDRQYACAVVEAFEQARNELELWASAVRYVNPDTGVARAWLSARGYGR